MSVVEIAAVADAAGGWGLLLVMGVISVTFAPILLAYAALVRALGAASRDAAEAKLLYARADCVIHDNEDPGA